MTDPRPQVAVNSIDEWRAWLEAHHDSSEGIWLITWKKGHGPHLNYDDIVDLAISYGWVDSQPRVVDAAHSARLLTPRRAGSSWSRVNKQRVDRLAEAGRMAPAGYAVVASAQRDGSWTALDDVENLVEPSQLRAELDAKPDARAYWDGFPRSARRSILEWIAAAKTDPTRDKRIQQTVTEAALGRRANQWRQPKT